MAEIVGTGEVVVVPNTKGFGTALSAQVSTVTKGLGASSGPLGKLNSLMAGFGVSSTVAFAAAGVAAVAFVKSSVEAYSEHQQILAQLQNAIEKSPAILDKSTKAFEDQATALQHLTGTTDEATLAADTILTRFGLTADQIKETMPLVLDYAQATGQDAATAATALGRALLGNTRALKTIGVTFKATGDRAMDLARIQDILKEKVGGAAEAFGETFAGKVAILKANFNDFQETIGKAVLPALTALVGGLTDAANALNGLIAALPGDGLGGILGTGFEAFISQAKTGFTAIQAISDLFHGRFKDSAEGAANALIPFWDPFTTGAEKATAAQDDFTSANRHAADVYVSSLVSMGAPTAAFNASVAEMRDRVLAMVPANNKAKDSISGITVRLYDANAAMQSFIQSINVYLGKIPALAGASEIATGIGNRTRTGKGTTQTQFKQHGGMVPGGYGGGDIVPAMLEPGELVIPKEQVRAGAAAGTGGGVTNNFYGPVYGMDDFERRVGEAMTRMFAGGAR